MDGEDKTDSIKELERLEQRIEKDWTEIEKTDKDTHKRQKSDKPFKKKWKRAK